MANYVAAILIVAAVALFVAAPLSGGFPRRRGASIRELEHERLEHERGLAVQGLRELEFDHEMGKLDEGDYRELKRSLEERALGAMSAIGRLRGAVRAAQRIAAKRQRVWLRDMEKEFLAAKKEGRKPAGPPCPLPALAGSPMPRSRTQLTRVKECG